MIFQLVSVVISKQYIDRCVKASATGKRGNTATVFFQNVATESKTTLTLSENCDEVVFEGYWAEIVYVHNLLQNNYKNIQNNILRKTNTGSCENMARNKNTDKSTNCDHMPVKTQIKNAEHVNTNTTDTVTKHLKIINVINSGQTQDESPVPVTVKVEKRKRTQKRFDDFSYTDISVKTKSRVRHSQRIAGELYGTTILKVDAPEKEKFCDTVIDDDQPALNDIHVTNPAHDEMTPKKSDRQHNKQINVETPRTPINSDDEMCVAISEPDLKQEMDCNTNQPVLECITCDYTTRREDYLVEHQQRVHLPDSEKIFQCSYCDKVFGVRRDCSRHIVRVHETEKCTCEKCGKTYKGQRNLVLHKYTHEENYSPPAKVPCSECDKIFCSEYVRDNHVKTIHRGIKKTLLCTTCGKVFSNIHTYKEHQNVHTGKRPYVCTVCGRGFHYIRSLHEHRYIHEDVRRFSCEHCGKAFKQSNSLTSHLRTHMSTRDYICPVCGRGFTQSGALARHIRTHTGTKPFQCIPCNRSFTDKSIVRRHVLLVHKAVGNWQSYVKVDKQMSKNFSDLNLLDNIESPCDNNSIRVTQSPSQDEVKSKTIKVPFKEPETVLRKKSQSSTFSEIITEYPNRIDQATTQSSTSTSHLVNDGNMATNYSHMVVPMDDYTAANRESELPVEYAMEHVNYPHGHKPKEEHKSSIQGFQQQAAHVSNMDLVSAALEYAQSRSEALENNTLLMVEEVEHTVSGLNAQDREIINSDQVKYAFIETVKHRDSNVPSSDGNAAKFKNTSLPTLHYTTAGCSSKPTPVPPHTVTEQAVIHDNINCTTGDFAAGETFSTYVTNIQPDAAHRPPEPGPSGDTLVQYVNEQNIRTTNYDVVQHVQGHVFHYY